jgi:hypothetical protein
LFEKVNELQRKLHELEIKNRKLKAKAWKMLDNNFNITNNIKITFEIQILYNNNIWFSMSYNLSCLEMCL